MQLFRRAGSSPMCREFGHFPIVQADSIVLSKNALQRNAIMILANGALGCFATSPPDLELRATDDGI